LKSSFDDACEVKYITPIVQNLIRFGNKVVNDYSVMECIKNIITEYKDKELGYELSVKSLVYRLLVILLRSHLEKLLTLKEYASQVRNLERLNKVLNHIENNYTEAFSVESLAALAGLSVFHFCHLFKKITGKTISDYVNRIRISKAEALLRSTDMNITEIALSTGFNDINYFSRLFKRYKNISPSSLRKRYED
jgi:AraC-like DNA-binding protein